MSNPGTTHPERTLLRWSTVDTREESSWKRDSQRLVVSVDVPRNAYAKNMS